MDSAALSCNIAPPTCLQKFSSTLNRGPGVVAISTVRDSIHLDMKPTPKQMPAQCPSRIENKMGWEGPRTVIQISSKVKFRIVI
jgi:hypothetical protein